MNQVQKTNPNSDSFTRSMFMLAALLVVFVIAAAVVAYLTFVGVRRFVSSWEITSLPGIVVKEGPTPTPGADGAADPNAVPTIPLIVPSDETPWDGASRVNVLVMGLDYRDWQAGEGAPRTDTMILLSLDPLSKTAAMLSIPRDLWVTIPGFQDPNRINTAYRFGEIYKYPGGGPALATKTVESLLGLQIDFYAQIDFSAFEKAIDEIGGVKIDVPKKIKVDPIVGDPVVLRPGSQVLPGNLALAYARARYTEGGDFDRAQRQQQVIMGIRNRLLSPGSLPKFIARAPAIYQELAAGVHTNMTLDQAVRLGWLAQQIPDENIKRGIIGPEQVNFVKSPEGDDVLKPLPQKIRLLRDELFTVDGPVSPAVADATPEDLMKAEGARVTILNGANTPGLATRTTDYLKPLGVNVVEAGDASEVSTYTTITDYTGNPKTVKYLVDLMKIPAQKIFLRYDPSSKSDVTIILGYDWANSNPMP
jgi:LCP family protein required for cell wall assembly